MPNKLPDLVTISNSVVICAVTKNKTVTDVEKLLAKFPFIKIIAENRWPDCVEKFEHFKNLQKHFIGPLQSNKVKKVVSLVDVIQSVDSLALLEKIDRVAAEEGKIIDFCFQVNISSDPAKQGINPDSIFEIIEQSISKNFSNVRLIGLMTIGAQVEPEIRLDYFKKFRKLFDEVNQKYFKEKPLPVLSMGMSEDYDLAIKAGSTMIRLGSLLFSE